MTSVDPVTLADGAPVGAFDADGVERAVRDLQIGRAHV